MILYPLSPKEELLILWLRRVVPAAAGLAIILIAIALLSVD